MQTQTCDTHMREKMQTQACEEKRIAEHVRKNESPNMRHKHKCHVSRICLFVLQPMAICFTSNKLMRRECWRVCPWNPHEPCGCPLKPSLWLPSSTSVTALLPRRWTWFPRRQCATKICVLQFCLCHHRIGASRFWNYTSRFLQFCLHHRTCPEH